MFILLFHPICSLDLPEFLLDVVAWYIYQTVVQNTVRTYEVNQVFRLVQGIWLQRQRGQNRFFFLGKELFSSCVRNML